MILIERSTDTPIRPRDIDSDTTFVNLFDQRESEIAAYWIVRYCQARRSWKPFSFENLTKFCGHHDQHFDSRAITEAVASLVVQKLVSSTRGEVTLTTSFVAHCYMMAPIPGLPRKRGPSRARAKRKNRYERLLENSTLP